MPELVDAGFGIRVRIRGLVSELYSSAPLSGADLPLEIAAGYALPPHPWVSTYNDG